MKLWRTNFWTLTSHHLIWYHVIQQGVKLIFSDSHLAPKFFKVVINSKKLVAIFYAVIVLEIKSGKSSLMCYKVHTRMDDMQCSSSPRSKMVSSYQSRCILETNFTRKFATDLSLQIFLIHYISSKVIMKHSSHQFGN